MQNENLIPVEMCRTLYNIEMSFIQSLDQFGFIHLVGIEETQFIDSDELQTLEKLIRLHYELDINMEGIEAINFLLERIRNMQNEIAYLKSKLNATPQYIIED
ncbi:MAG: MerR family transcriptional regulator [Parafilimonas sp.]|nr:MerR family transcriptional regulator [Parafilimonas sp.]